MDRFETIFVVAMILCAITTGTAVGIYIGKDLNCPECVCNPRTITVDPTCPEGERLVCAKDLR